MCIRDRNILALYEPRIDDIIVEAEPRPANSEFELTVSYKIVGQAVELQTYSFILEATR